MFKRHSNNKAKRRKGFTLVECIVSIAIFAIMGTMFATFMVSSVRVVNLTIANEDDREFLLEAIATYDENPTYESEFHDGKVTISAIEDATGKNVTLNMDLSYTDAHDPSTSNRKYSLKFLDKNAYLLYTTDSGTQYCIYLGENTKVPTIDETLDPGLPGGGG